MEKYFFEANGVRISVGEDAERITKGLGKPNKINRAASCAGIGEDIIYIYNGFRIFSYLENGKEEVRAVELTSDNVSTPEGAGLGDSAERVIATYGVADRRDKNAIEYERCGVKLRFVLLDGAVSSVKYLACDE